MKLSFPNIDLPKKRAALAVAAVILVAGVVAGRERPAIELLQERAPRAAAAADDGIDIDKMRRAESSLPQKDPFASAALGVHKQGTSQEGAKASAPPLPFQYFGRLTENGKTEVYVMRGEELLTIAAGQKIGEYRVDRIDPAAISFTYLPLKTKQQLSLQ
jgi:hypothetical protein